MPHLTEKQLNAFADSWRGKSKYRALWTKAESAARALNDFEEVLGDFYVETSNARLDRNEFNVSMGEEAIPDGEEGHPRYHQTHPLRIDQHNNTLILVCNWCEVELWVDSFGEQEPADDELFPEIQRRLKAKQIYFEEQYTGGNIWLIKVGEPEGPEIWVDDCGSVAVYQDPEEMSEEPEELFEGSEEQLTQESMRNLARQTVEAIEKAIDDGKIENVWREG